MRSPWAIGGALALALGAATAHAADVEPIGEVSQAATPAGTACRVGCATSYAALCIRVRNICAIGSVVTLGEAVIPCATAVAVTCLSATAVAVICADRCPP